ncbi:MAG: hypothetical protein JRI34_03230 [Deltaproteobacteria bacterium]|nr:hypothetical protein [Deltaproteobacteria bacterium]
MANALRGLDLNVATVPEEGLGGRDDLEIWNAAQREAGHMPQINHTEFRGKEELFPGFLAFNLSRWLLNQTDKMCQMSRLDSLIHTIDT